MSKGGGAIRSNFKFGGECAAQRSLSAKAASLVYNRLDEPDKFLIFTGTSWIILLISLLIIFVIAKIIFGNILVVSVILIISIFVISYYLMEFDNSRKGKLETLLVYKIKGRPTTEPDRLRREIN